MTNEQLAQEREMYLHEMSHMAISVSREVVVGVETLECEHFFAEFNDDNMVVYQKCKNSVLRIYSYRTLGLAVWAATDVADRFVRWAYR